MASSDPVVVVEALKRRYGDRAESLKGWEELLSKLFDQKGNPIPTLTRSIQVEDVRLSWLTEEMVYIGIGVYPGEVDYLLIPKNPTEFFQRKFAELGHEEPRLLSSLVELEEELLESTENPVMRMKGYVVSSTLLPRDVIHDVVSHPNFRKQEKEWREMGLSYNSLNDSPLPLDTSYFDDLLELKKVEVDGILIKGDSYLSLKWLLNVGESDVKLTYIDPPFNKERERDFSYSVKYTNHIWLTMLENRISLAKRLLREDGVFFVRCDHDGNMLVRMLMDRVFGEDKFRNEIDIKRNQSLPKTSLRRLTEETENLLVYGMDEFKFKRMFVPRNPSWVDLGTRPSEGERGKPIRINGVEFYPPEKRRWAYSEDKVRELHSKGLVREVRGKLKILLDKRAVGTNWTDIPGYSTNPRWGLKTENSEVLLKRVIESSSDLGQKVMDFFLGSGTTVAVAHKMGRKWIGVELGDHFSSVVMRRMKMVLAGEKGGISKEQGWKGGGAFKYVHVSWNYPKE
jgi:hypothetical protein